jgi:hypothetical protein
MPTMIFSAPNKFWRPLCTNAVRPETSVNGDVCQACVVPVVVPPPVTCGEVDWIVQEISDLEGTRLEWQVAVDGNRCTGGGTPNPPPDPPTTLFDTATTDCECP